MITSKAIKNPIIKILGISIILYFVLLSDKKDPKSLGNRLSSKNIKKNLSEASNKIKFISGNLILAREMQKKKLNHPLQTTLSCGDIAKISYGIYNKAGLQLEFIEESDIIIKQDNPTILEKNSIGLEAGKTKIVALNISSNVIEAENLMKYKDIPGIEIHIKLLSFTKNPAKINCQN